MMSDNKKPCTNCLQKKFNKNNEQKQKYTSERKNKRKTIVKTTQIIGDYLKQKDVAPWFRGTSMYHMQGANMLLNALRDDAEQSTTHRIRSCLNLIGLVPMINSKEIKCLMKLSRGNDLAFLWFLMEMHYKTPKPGPYSINEQLICSAICHLDTITTLKELDKILPNGHPSRREIKVNKAKRKELKVNYKEKALLTYDKNKPKYVLPYFEKIRRPIPYGKPLTLVIPGFRVRFDNYQAYSNPNHVVHNESNRWYANYNLNAGRRIAHCIIRDTIGNLFENFESASLKADTIETLCDYHKSIKEMELKLERELKVKARDKCLKHFFGNGKEKEKRAEHIRQLLDKAVEQQLCHFRKEANTLRKEMTLKTITSDCDIFDVMLGSEFNQCCCDEQSAKIETKSCIVTAKENIKSNIITTKENIKLETSNKKENGPANGDGDNKNDKFSDLQQKCEISYGGGDTLNKNEMKTNRSVNNRDDTKLSPTLSHMEEFGEKYMRNYEYRNVAGTPTPSQTFFHGPKLHQPYKFDYRKIFTTKPKSNEMRQLKMAFLEALDKDISKLRELQDSELKLNEAASECANGTFDQAVKQYEIDNKDAIAAKALEMSRPLSQYPKMGYYNCRDHILMDRMLFDAIAHLRKNPKFVLAQLPDAHKLPMLREWIYQRFGKEYTPKERAKAFRLSCNIFRALDKIKFDFPLPNARQMGKQQIADYNSRKYFEKRCQEIKNEYYRRLDNAFMEQTRIFWFATRAYICSNGPPRKIFFSYMPSRIRDIQHFRLWKSSEFRNYIGAWTVRQRAKRREQFSG